MKLPIHCFLSTTKMKFSAKNCNLSILIAQNIDRGYTFHVEPRFAMLIVVSCYIGRIARLIEVSY